MKIYCVERLPKRAQTLAEYRIPFLALEHIFSVFFQPTRHYTSILRVELDLPIQHNNPKQTNDRIAKIRLAK